ncbi:hypothetical protein H8S02_01335 [Agathobaculum sp. M2]|uniref:TrbL/VirB6 plasmid conjugal transfer protein n=2 Tax=Agathobaculum hominis TaxID=2763014 RepID=A0ABR7GJV3_9FIRM|nr:hypothetical protein [Agathobaculum hominis]
MWYEMVEKLLRQLMTLLRVDTSYFASRVPVVKDIATILLAVGWALLIGNLAYQALRSMASGVGIEAEEPGRLFLRTAMFSFLLVCSRQICDIALSLSAVIMRMLEVPKAVTFTPFNEDFFSELPNAGWLVVIVVNVYIQWQIIKLFFEVAERYVILCVLIYCAPLAFAMGGSKSTAEIFRGWLRMFASMCTLMVLNVMFVKMLLSAMSNSPTGAAIVPWIMLITGIVRVAKKMDSIILRIGLNPAITGDPLGHHHVPGMLSAMLVHHAASFIKNTISNPPHPTNTAAAPPSGPLAYGMGRQVGNGQPSQLSASSGSSTQNNTQQNSNFSYGSSARHTVSSHMPHQYADISIDADDFTDGDFVTMSNPAHSGAARITPVAPQIRPLPHDFAKTPPPVSPQSARPPVVPHGASAVQGAQNIGTSQNTPQTSVHSAMSHDFIAPQAAEHSAENTSVQPQSIEHSTQTEKNGGTHGQQSGRISPVTPPRPAGIREVKTAEHTENHSSAQTKVSSFGHNTENYGSSAIMQTSERAVASKAAQLGGTAQNVESSHRISNMQSVRSDTAPQAKYNSAAVKPDITPQRNRGTSAAARPNISPVSPVKPTVQPPKAQTAPKNPVSPVSQPRTLRRSAEPVKSNNIIPQNGGERHAGRKRKP